MGVVAAFVDRFVAVFPYGDPAAYAALFDYPCVFFSDHGADIRHAPSEVADRLRHLAATAHEMQAERVCVQVMAAWPIGAALTVARVETCLHLRGGGRTDVHAESWILRHVGDRLKLAAIVNPLSASILGALPRHPPVVQPGPGLRLHPSEIGDPRGFDRFIDAHVAAFHRNRADEIVGLLGLPYVRFTDHATDVIDHAGRLHDMVVNLYAELQAQEGVQFAVQRRYFRPFGDAHFNLRVDVSFTGDAGVIGDPAQEIWLLRLDDDALRLAAIINPPSSRLAPQIGPAATGVRP